MSGVLKLGTGAFGAKVGVWAGFWSDHMESLGLKPEQLGILILDEPHEKAQYDIITAWAKAIEAGAPGLVTWEDPQPQEDKDCLEMFSSVDVLCPYRHPFLAQPDWYRELFLGMQKQGKDLWFYNADGPARCFDPYSFYLAQQWHCFKIGAKGSCFWAFGDNGGVSCWNEYPAGGSGPYCPTYLDQESITAAKYMEAIREGVQDFEYLTMLKARVEELAAEGVPQDRLARARELLATGPDRVLAMEKGANYRWDEVKDRSVQDKVRIEVLQALVDLREEGGLQALVLPATVYRADDGVCPRWRFNVVLRSERREPVDIVGVHITGRTETGETVQTEEGDAIRSLGPRSLTPGGVAVLDITDDGATLGQTEAVEVQVDLRTAQGQALNRLCRVAVQPRHTVYLGLPLKGRWVVANGRDVMHSAGVCFGLDLIAQADRELATRAASGPVSEEDFAGFGQAVLAPADGVVVAAVDGREDFIPTPGTASLSSKHPADRSEMLGNYVLIDTGEGAYVLMAHLRRGSLLVKAGDTVQCGAEVAQVGNSGNSSAPHLHIEVLDGILDPSALLSTRFKQSGVPFGFREVVCRGGGAEERTGEVVPQTGDVVETSASIDA